MILQCLWPGNLYTCSVCCLAIRQTLPSFPIFSSLLHWLWMKQLLKQTPVQAPGYPWTVTDASHPDNKENKSKTRSLNSLKSLECSHWLLVLVGPFKGWYFWSSWWDTPCYTVMRSTWLFIIALSLGEEELSEKYCSFTCSN